jgi:predicted enzyme related to lactoylglutathione lyase
MYPDHKPVNYVLVESVDDFSKKIQRLDDKIIVPKTPIPNMGAFAVGLDPEGYPVGIFESISENEWLSDLRTSGGRIF